MNKLRRWLGRNAIRLYAVVAFAYLFVPVAYSVLQRVAPEQASDEEA